MCSSDLEIDIVPKEISPKDKTKEETVSALKTINGSLEKIEKWDKESIEKSLADKPERTGWSKTDLFQMIRYVQTGSRAAPPLFETLEAIGKEVTVARIKKATTLLS